MLNVNEINGAAKVVPTTKIEIEIPEGMEMYVNDIRRFVDAMLYKLERNTRKGRWENIDINTAFSLLHREVAELKEEIGGNSIKTILEAADVANFAMIIASIATERGK